MLGRVPPLGLIFQKTQLNSNASYETRDTKLYATIPYAMLCIRYIHRYFRLKSVVFLSLHSSVQTGIPVLYATVLILTDGLRIYCGNTSESKRKASSAPALFILVAFKIQGRLSQYCTSTVPVTNSFVLAFAWPFLSVGHAFAVCHKIWPYRRDAFAAIFLKKLNLFFRTVSPGRSKINYGWISMLKRNFGMRPRTIIKTAFLRVLLTRTRTLFAGRNWFYCCWRGRDVAYRTRLYSYSVSYGTNLPQKTPKNIFCIETRLAVSVDLSRPAEETQEYSTVVATTRTSTRTVQARKPKVTILPLWKKNLCRRAATLRRT